MLSKTLAEEAAWKFSKENGIDMVTINPGWVIGPLLQPTLNLSAEQVLNLINGKFDNIQENERKNIRIFSSRLHTSNQAILLNPSDTSI